MSSSSKDSYLRSCNPPRSAKQQLHAPKPDSKAQNPAASHPRSILPILPKHSSATAAGEDNASLSPPPPPGSAKRGRKPGPLSRSARETQRKLNHSIIEKARRTRINDALAMLQRLVPQDYGYQKHEVNEDGEDDRGKNKPKTKGSGKREEKEKDFKLEILIRTVSFMQDLLTRVELLEASARGCPKCNERESPKRKRGEIENNNDDPQDLSNKRLDQRNERRDTRNDEVNPIDQSSPTNKTHSSRPYLGSRLPSISSWLPNSEISPILLPPELQLPDDSSQLPSPPPSTHVKPAQTSQIPPSLNIGPVAISSFLTPVRTPEDESAASSLLQISASSPQLLPISSPSSSCTSFELSKLRTPAATRYNARTSEFGQAQTPGSLLGLSESKKA